MEVKLIDFMGSDLTVVNAARVSFGKESEYEGTCIYCKKTMKNSEKNEDCPKFGNGIYKHDLGNERLSKADKSLIAFLARGCTSKDWEGLIKKSELLGDRSKGGKQEHKDVEDLMNYIKSMPSHWTPFGHCQISLHFKVPLFVARQIHKHQTGFVVNEVSRRYVTDTPEFYMPDKWRKAALNVKQGSLDGDTGYHFNKFRYENKEKGEENIFDLCLEEYEDMISKGVCAEQARMVLPQSMYTEFWMTGSLYGFANMYKQRSDQHAQREIQEVAKQIGEIIEPLFPVSWKELVR